MCILPFTKDVWSIQFLFVFIRTVLFVWSKVRMRMDRSKVQSLSRPIENFELN